MTRKELSSLIETQVVEPLKRTLPQVLRDALALPRVELPFHNPANKDVSPTRKSKNEGENSDRYFIYSHRKPPFLRSYPSVDILRICPYKTTL